MNTVSLSRSKVIVMSLAAGIAVANIYFSQPILKEIAASCVIPDSKAGSISVLSLLGYGAGLFFLTPLGDKINRKVLILVVQSFLMMAMIGMIYAGDYQQVCILSFAIGFFSIVARLILAMAASLDLEEKSKTVAFLNNLLNDKVASVKFNHCIYFDYLLSEIVFLLILPLIFRFTGKQF